MFLVQNLLIVEYLRSKRTCLNNQLQNTILIVFKLFKHNERGQHFYIQFKLVYFNIRRFVVMKHVNYDGWVAQCLSNPRSLYGQKHLTHSLLSFGF